MGRKKGYDREVLVEKAMELFRDHGFAGTVAAKASVKPDFPVVVPREAVGDRAWVAGSAPPAAASAAGAFSGSAGAAGASFTP